MSTGADKSYQTGPQDRSDTFKGNGPRVRKAPRAMGKGGTSEPNGDGSRPKGKA